jgi:Holliday junction resolvase RusA-like endonuclease
MQYKKIAIEALMSKFGDENIATSLWVVAEATPNPCVAIELMLGIFEHPSVAKTVNREYKPENREILSKEGYDIFTGSVKYRYRDRSRVTIMIAENAPMPTYDEALKLWNNGASKTNYSNNKRVTVYGPGSGQVYEDEIALDIWNNGTAIDNKYALAC